MRIAVVGSGISGLVSAWLLSKRHEVVVYEADSRIGGHTHTVEVNGGERTFAVDTGFIVFNPENYPLFTRLMGLLGVESQPSNMSFSVRDERSGLEYNGTSLNSLFAQRRNLLRPGFLRMVRDIVRFFRDARELVGSSDFDLTLGDFVASRGYSREFMEWHLFPLASAVWSTGPSGITRFPAVALARFFNNHGFLQVEDRPRWRVLVGGSRSYLEPLSRPFRSAIRLGSPVAAVRRDPASVRVRTRGGDEDRFDHVVITAHSDQAIGMLEDPSPAEREVLGAIRYTPNDTVLHTDESLLPRRPRARASWNYHLPVRDDQLPSVTYWMNLLQSIPGPTRFCVTLNRTDRIDPSRWIRRMTYEHPLYDSAALRAQLRRKEISGVNRTSYCGAYWGYGFHEDGVRSAVEACRPLGVDL